MWIEILPFSFLFSFFSFLFFFPSRIKYHRIECSIGIEIYKYTISEIVLRDIYVYRSNPDIAISGGEIRYGENWDETGTRLLIRAN